MPCELIFFRVLSTHLFGCKLEREKPMDRVEREREERDTWSKNLTSNCHCFKFAVEKKYNFSFCLAICFHQNFLRSTVLSLTLGKVMYDFFFLFSGYKTVCYACKSIL